MSVAALEPRIRQILLSTPSTELSTITAKDVRSQLVQTDPSLSQSWIKEHKKEINALIANVFEALSSSLTIGGAQNGVESPQKRQKEEDDDMGIYGGYEGVGADGGMNGAGGGSATPPPKQKKAKTKRELTDEEYARQLAAELNGSTRSSRSGKAPSARTARKGSTNRTPRKNKKSAERVDDSDMSDGGDSEVQKKPKKKRASAGGGGGGAKGGFQKEFILSAPLSALLEVDKLSRPQVVKQLWNYIKANDLQNPTNKREIICDDRLRPVFSTDKIDMFKMNKVLGSHLHEEE